LLTCDPSAVVVLGVQDDDSGSHMSGEIALTDNEGDLVYIEARVDRDAGDDDTAEMTKLRVRDKTLTASEP
jgi:hypothetical protein